MVIFAGATVVLALLVITWAMYQMVKAFRARREFNRCEQARSALRAQFVQRIAHASTDEERAALIEELIQDMKGKKR